MSDAHNQKPWERVAHGVMDVVGSTAQKVFGYHTKPALDTINHTYEEKEKERHQNDLDQKLRASFKELENTQKLYDGHLQELKDLTEKEQFQSAVALEKEAALKELYARQDAEKHSFFAAQEERNKAVFSDLSQQRGVLFDKEYAVRLELHEAILQQRADEQRARETLLEQRRQETEVAKPDFDDVTRAEETRNAAELDQLDKDHERTLQDAHAAADKAVAKGLDQEEANRRVAELAERLAAEREAKIKEQQERWNRIETLYGRDR